MASKKAIALIVPLVVIGGGIGGIAGWFLGSMFKETGPLVNEALNDKPTVYNANYEAVKKLNDVTGCEDGNYSSINIEDKIGVNGLSAFEVADAVMYKVYKNDYVQIKSLNFAHSVAMGVNNDQTTYSCFMKSKNVYFKENISYSNTVSFAERYTNYDLTQEVNPINGRTAYENQIDYFRSNKNKKLDVDYQNASTYTAFYQNIPAEPKEGMMTFSQFFGISAFGAYNVHVQESFALRDEDTNYLSANIIDSKSTSRVLFDNSVVKEEGGYLIRVALSKEAPKKFEAYTFTTTRDQTKLAVMSEPPIHSAYGVELHCDENLRLTSYRTLEEYDVVSSIAGKVPTQSTSDCVVTYNEEQTPGLKDKISYDGLKWWKKIKN